jgi:hypothetical protein
VEDAWLTATAGLALAVQLGALPFVWRGRRPRLLALVNLSIALPVLWVLLDRPHLFAAPVDWPVLGLTLFEMVATVSALTLAAEWRRIAWLAGTVFVVHLLMSAAALLFALFFRMTRLI